MYFLDTLDYAILNNFMVSKLPGTEIRILRMSFADGRPSHFRLRVMTSGEFINHVS